MFFPVALRLAGRKAVVLGGDAEAAAKAQQLLSCEASVTVVSHAAVPAIERLAEAGELRWERRAYQEGDLEGAAIAICCDPAVGRAAREEASQRGVLLNVLDQPELCDFLAVATFARDALQFAVHSSGKSAALSRRIRERLERQFGDVYADLTDTLGRLRSVVRDRIDDAEARRAFWLDVITEEFLDRIESGFSLQQIEEEILLRAEAFARQHSRTALRQDRVQPPTTQVQE
jgi:precorrin-2 dehydrogenase/sirohydrochlorin ferrochelatase